MLAARKLQAATLLAQGKLCRDVAAAVEVTPQTISEWKKDPAFESYLNSLRQEWIMGAVAQIQYLTGRAAATVAELMEPGNPESVRLKAAALVLNHPNVVDPNKWWIGPIMDACADSSRAIHDQIQEVVKAIRAR